MVYTKKELVEDLAGLDLIFKTKKAADDTVEFIIAKIIAEVESGKQVSLSGLCSFKPAIQKAKTGNVPGRPGQLYTSPEKRVVRIAPAAAFRARVAQ